MLLPGVGALDPRVVANPSIKPWSAIARLQVAGVSRCTAVMVLPNFAVTAAHCLTKPGLGHFVQAGSIHLLLGYDAGNYTRHIVPDAVILLPSTDAGGVGSRAADVAVLHFAPPVSDTLMLDAAPAGAGTPLTLAGFNQDRIERLAIDPECRVLGIVTGPLVAHDCTGTRGTSGGPLLRGDAGSGYRVLGIQVAGRAGTGGLAVPAATIARMLPAPDLRP